MTASSDRITVTIRDLDEIIANAAARAYDVGFCSGKRAAAGEFDGVIAQRSMVSTEAVVKAHGDLRTLVRRGRAESNG